MVPTIITTIFPLYDFTKNIVADKAEVVLLLPPGVEPHSFEPRPGDIIAMNKADVFIYTGRFMEPWVEGILKGVGNKGLMVIDASNGISLIEDRHNHNGHNRIDKRGVDPHIWLDLSNAMKMVDTIVDGLSERYPEDKEFYKRNGMRYKALLDELDGSYREGLTGCKRHIFIHGGHSAFNYLARRYGLEYISAYKGSLDTEPTPKDIVRLKKVMEEHGIRHIYYEELIEPKIAQAISRDTGAKLLRLHGAHNISKDELRKGVTFISIMEENLESLEEGLECK